MGKAYLEKNYLNFAVPNQLRKKSIAKKEARRQVSGALNGISRYEFTAAS